MLNRLIRWKLKRMEAFWTYQLLSLELAQDNVDLNKPYNYALESREAVRKVIKLTSQ